MAKEKTVGRSELLDQVGEIVEKLLYLNFSSFAFKKHHPVTEESKRGEEGRERINNAGKKGSRFAR